MNVLEIVDITNLDVSERNRLDKQMMYCVAVIQILIFGADRGINKNHFLL